MSSISIAAGEADSKPQVLSDRVFNTGSVAVLGLGYVGLPTALAFGEAGHRVIGIDVSEERLGRIKSRDVDLVPDDHARLRDALGSHERFVLTHDVSAMQEADTVIVCVPTPVDAHMMPDLSLLRGACRQVVEAARPGQMIVLTSTTYVGTTRDLLVDPLKAAGLTVGQDVNVAFSPERINPGVTSHSQSEVPRVVGGATPECTGRAADFFGGVTKAVYPVASPETAELTKLFENTFRAVNIAFVNEMANTCHELGVDVTQVLDAAGTKPYGFMRFNPGPGVGGHCIPCDPHYLLWQLRAHRVSMPILETAMRAIAHRPVEVIERISDLLASVRVVLESARILVVGVAYKPNVEDVRESPAIEIVSRLLSRGAEVTVTDPHVPSMRLNDGISLVTRQLGDVDVSEFDLVLLHTRHSADDLSGLSGAKIVLDATYSLSMLESAVML